MEDMARRKKPCKSSRQMLCTWWFVAPNHQDVAPGSEVRLPSLVEHLLVDLLIVLWQANPFSQKRQAGPKEMFHIFDEEVRLNGVTAIFEQQHLRLHVLKSRLLEQTSE